MIIIDYSSDLDKKKEIIINLTHELNVGRFEENTLVYTLIYQPHWWSFSYNIYISIDDEKFLISVLGKTYSYPSSGFIDLGGTERLRRQIIYKIKYMLNERKILKS